MFVYVIMHFILSPDLEVEIGAVLHIPADIHEEENGKKWLTLSTSTYRYMYCVDRNWYMVFKELLRYNVHKH